VERVKRLDEIFRRLPSWVLFLVCLVMTVFVGVIDDLTGPETTMTLFYVMPISLASWYGSRSMGFTVAIVAIATLMTAEIESGRHYAQLYSMVWNNLARFGLLTFISYLVASLRERFDVERSLAETDPLTAAFNGRAFRERAATEIHRLARYHRPFTVAYLDVDDFKKVNDIHGHAVGD
jgi:predicted signal transduction protein with EAL and GGDEF domain